MINRPTKQVFIKIHTHLQVSAVLHRNQVRYDCVERERKL